MPAKSVRSLVILVLVVALAIAILVLGNSDDANLNDITGPFATLHELDVVNREMPSMQDLSQRPTLVVMWTTWCPSCIDEMLHLRDNYGEFHSRVNVIAVNLTQGERSRQAVHDFLEGADLPFTVLLDPDGKAGEQFASRYIPANFLVNTEGETVNMMEGPITLDILDQWLGEG